MEIKSRTMTDITIDYYEKNAEEFIESTVTADLDSLYKIFEENLFSGCKVLDLGCGSGRDTKHFLESGFSVVKIDDMEKALIKCVHAIKTGGIMYASWKYGNGERIVDERRYSDFTEKSIREILRKIKGIRVLLDWSTEDIRNKK